MPNAKSNVERQSLDPEHELPPSENEDVEETGKQNAEAVPAAKPTDEEFQKVRAERDMLLDRLARSQAEMENTRKRAAKEQEEFREYALIDAVNLLLPIVDSFDQALQHTEDVEQFRSGMKLIHRQLLDALKKIGVQQIPVEGERFNPEYQEAVQLVDTTDAEDNKVLEVLQPGYKLKNRILRPARVRIARNPAK